MSSQAIINQPKNKKFWNFVAAADNNSPAELILYGNISSTSWWGDEVTPKQFNNDLNALGDVSEIVVHVNSGGGDVFAATAIYTRLKSHKANITVVIDGWAASAATIIAMAGDVIQIPAAGAFMIHDPAMGVSGYFGAEDFAKLSDELKVIKNCIINAYALKTGKSSEEISALMTAETWYTGEESVRNGFCDKLLFDEVETKIENSSQVVVNSIPFDITNYPKIPSLLLNSPAVRSGGGFPYMQDQKNKKESENEMQDFKTVDELKAAFPDLTRQITDSATAAERKRIQDIDGITIAGFEGIISTAKYEKPATAAEVALAIIAAQQKAGTTYLADRDADITASGVKEIGGGAGSETGNPKAEGNIFDAAIDTVLPVNK